MPLLVAVCLLLFLAVELEWLGTIRAWSRQCLDSGRVTLRENPLAVRYAAVSAPTVALVVIEECLVAVAFLVTALLAAQWNLVTALIIVQLANKLGHLVESARAYSYTPGMAASALGLPWYAFALWQLLGRPDVRWEGLLAALLVALIALYLNDALVEWLEPRVDRRLRGLARSAPQRMTEGIPVWARR
jgi:hypothetical protein